MGTKNKKVKKEFFIYFGIIIFVILFGAFLNMQAMKANNGKMPVKIDKEITGKAIDEYIQINEDFGIKKQYLGDLIEIKIINKKCYSSIGDILIWLGSISYVILFYFFVRNKFIKN